MFSRKAGPQQDEHTLGVLNIFQKKQKTKKQGKSPSCVLAWVFVLLGTQPEDGTDTMTIQGSHCGQESLTTRAP